ncbi:MAG: cobalamin B12-binding domain-containing protein, partial [Candidatus Omnitrophota bacterium]|nr:cobalamin B12-binding domain-containing protein [Candidatus Omnitrophota bacterium]
MRILLLNPPFKNGRFSRASRSPAITRSGTLYYPIWLAYAAGVLEKDGFEVKIVDCPAAGLSAPEAVKMAADFKPDLVVIDTSTPSIYSDVETGRLIQNKAKGAFIVLVGTHPSALP